MEKTLEQVLLEAVTKAIDLAEQTGEFVISQAPDLIQQFLLWKLWTNVLRGIIALFFIIGPVILIKTVGSKEKKPYLDTRLFNRWFEAQDLSCVGSVALLILGWIVGAIMFINSLFDIVYITVAPKIYLIDYFLSK